MSDSLFIQLGDQKRVSFPALAGTATLKNATGVELFYLLNGDWQQLRVGTTVQTPFSYDLLTIKAVLSGLHEVALEIRPDAAPETATTVKVAVARVAMAIDSNRDGSLDYGDPGRDNWVWERGHPGAVLIVNNDKDISDSKPAPGQRSEWSELAILPLELSQVPAGATLHLHATPDAARRFAVYEYASDNTYRRVLGRELDSEDYISQSPPLPLTGGKYFVEAREYPGPFFEGLITIELYLLSDGAPIARDRVVFRTAPWIMTPNTLPVVKVFTCEVRDANDAPNELFLEGLRTALVEAKVPLHVIPDEDHLGDRWIQDEVEFGYVQGATHFIPVVFDSPRDRQLDGFPEKSLLGPDLGHFQIGGSRPNSLDSFGNLEVSPPVVVNGRNYPFGRIVFGGRQHGDYSDVSRAMMPEVRKFLYSQKVQSPFEIFTDWLTVGHVDEIVCFVPAPTRLGFKVLLASPESAKALLTRLSKSGHGKIPMFVGRRRANGASAELSIDALLGDRSFWTANDRFQDYMNLNAGILRSELGLSASDIISIPVLFHPTKSRTAAYFPDMVNHLVIGDMSIVPKPYGPLVDGVCAFERAFSKAVPWRTIRFIDDWYSYHEQFGEVHCGTNVIRSPFPNKNWWDYKPDGGFDIRMVAETS